MDFLNALNQAALQGISKEEFLPVWQSEMKLRLFKEESYLLELKVKLMEASEKEQLPRTTTTTTTASSSGSTAGMEALILQQFQEQKEQLSQFKTDLLTYQQALLQVLGNVSSLLGSVISPWTTGAGKEETSRTDPDLLLATLKDKSRIISATNSMELLISDDEDFGANNPVDLKYDPGLTLSSSQWDRVTISESGVEFTVRCLSLFVKQDSECLSPSYAPPSCPCAFNLNVSFEEGQELNLYLLVKLGEELDHSARWPISISSKGYIKNKSSKGFSQIWDLPNEKGKKLRKLKSTQEVKIPLPLVLKTGTGLFNPVDVDLLDARNYIIDDTITFKWSVDVLEAGSGNLLT
ncbi:uncharacterized protein LOC101859125 isoform X2 [Aplysia californica]|uniref:Uncharacterized protein LOC101859125 isoform X2 n=1 Tax=Aplysia californica TaxID=6500 RepID=A0ABM0K1H0_APLCA|nr:uncharacterized protein LOC101859125 isoform X2 [Aplysia californica]